MKSFLSLKAPVKDGFGEANPNEMFYRYNICDDDGKEVATVCFTQYQDNGCIYSGRVRLSDANMRNEATIFLQDNCTGCYPASYYVCLSSTRLLPHEIESYKKLLDIIHSIGECAMSVFELEEHRSKYYKEGQV